MHASYALIMAASALAYATVVAATQVCTAKATVFGLSSIINGKNTTVHAVDSGSGFNLEFKEGKGSPFYAIGKPGSYNQTLVLFHHDKSYALYAEPNNVGPANSAPIAAIEGTGGYYDAEWYIGDGTAYSTQNQGAGTSACNTTQDGKTIPYVLSISHPDGETGKLTPGCVFAPLTIINW